MKRIRALTKLSIATVYGREATGFEWRVFDIPISWKKARRIARACNDALAANQVPPGWRTYEARLFP